MKGGNKNQFVKQISFLGIQESEFNSSLHNTKSYLLALDSSGETDLTQVMR